VPLSLIWEELSKSFELLFELAALFWIGECVPEFSDLNNRPGPHLYALYCSSRLGTLGLQISQPAVAAQKYGVSQKDYGFVLFMDE
jgi:hypothetical protein